MTTTIDSSPGTCPVSGELGETPEVVRNDEITRGPRSRAGNHGHRDLAGPGPAKRRGNSAGASSRSSRASPILASAWATSAIGEVFGGKVVRADALVHGKTSAVIHTGRGIFLDVDNPSRRTRYHSLILSRRGLPEKLQIMAWTPRTRSCGPPQGIPRDRGASSSFRNPFLNDVRQGSAAKLPPSRAVSPSPRSDDPGPPAAARPRRAPDPRGNGRGQARE